ncbi:hypothetical protein DYI37_11555 [Fulvimarina endophytica]|uniref:Uncharacterized protein n=1 Tax=Fulvimarina endophytica TaxID=2293836 RepID=A0A371X344_9HYPH|nr:hypothetical protein [Fulvimarina endophytica]RFC63633.1 hypothetical protein DYI37_11555 [Fulvimarina endophytica]
MRHVDPEFPFLSRLADRLATSTSVDNGGEPTADAVEASQAVVSAPFEALEMPDGPVSLLFEAAVSGVQSRLPHLSHADIAYPPHGLFDAQLARQIALHLLVHRLGAPKQRVARELARSREAVNRALKIIDERMTKPEFATAYEAMADHALHATQTEQDHQ